jgi:hypothetical protein
LVAPRQASQPALEITAVDLSCYDELLVEQCLAVLP